MGPRSGSGPPGPWDTGQVLNSLVSILLFLQWGHLPALPSARLNEKVHLSVSGFAQTFLIILERKWNSMERGSVAGGKFQMRPRDQETPSRELLPMCPFGLNLVAGKAGSLFKCALRAPRWWGRAVPMDKDMDGTPQGLRASPAQLPVGGSSEQMDFSPTP